MPAADPPVSKDSAASGDTSVNVSGLDVSELIDMETFGQITEMDDGDDDEFSRTIVEGFLEQAEDTFSKMDQALKDKDLEQLSSLGHFLKGSSATLGLIKIKDHCECIQHFGAGKDETGTGDIEDQGLCLKKIEEELAQMRDDFEKVERYFAGRYPS